MDEIHDQWNQRTLSSECNWRTACGIRSGGALSKAEDESLPRLVTQVGGLFDSICLRAQWSVSERNRTADLKGQSGWRLVDEVANIR
jgi:hypothetical protein